MWTELCQCTELQILFGVQDIAYGYRYDGLVETLAQGDEIAEAMAGKRLFFHRNHGVILGVDNVARVQILT